MGTLHHDPHQPHNPLLRVPARTPLLHLLSTPWRRHILRHRSNPRPAVPKHLWLPSTVTNPLSTSPPLPKHHH
ncbi:hypothetical protein BDD12DRAFT_856710 [Trichophaea hybrida]|nr:hypothetical protein BDD12DRAFT_856710 [Trichophaea hybrida]